MRVDTIVRKADVFFEGNLITEQAVNAENADRHAVEHDRNSEKRDAAFSDMARSRFVEEQRFRADIRYDEGLSRSEYPSRDAFTWPVDASPSFFVAQTVRSPDNQMSGILIAQRYGGPLHRERVRQDAQDGIEDLIQPECLAP